ncbi:hypothetical protein FHS15_005760 [Paenibacillus castaneae]|nr:hypothetical protein [Paenibacillus castaneae]NIK80569.1 hypothetical protein [Paenibacillus castaneae]
MKLTFKLIAVLLGLYLIYEAYSIYTFTARSPNGSMGIRKFFF